MRSGRNKITTRATFESAILSAVFFNAMLMVALIPLALQGVNSGTMSAAHLPGVTSRSAALEDRSPRFWVSNWLTSCLLR